MKRKVKWHSLQVKWEHILNAQLKEDLLRVNEYGDEVLVCETKHGPFLFESSENTKKKT